MKKCPPGVICLENFSMLFIIIFVGIIGYLIYINNTNKTSEVNIYESANNNNNNNTNKMPSFFNWFRPNYPYTNYPGEGVYQDPYVPPLRDERYLTTSQILGSDIRGAVPINIPTNSIDTNYRQMGMITPLNSSSKDNILPLMGRPLHTSRQKYQYYTISNQHNNVKLPISVKGRSGTNENGVDELYNGDTVYVEGYDEAFKITKYDNDTIRYIPYV
jgi:hypothetical protein